jgi:4-amino-4-deoxy-L-arabinose transferase-like glycosyltransferase
VAWIPLAVFAVLLLHGGLLGLTDDEAYYWVLAQRPAAGYAFHPPGVAWLIAASETLFGWLFGAREWIVRLPAAACSAALVGLGLSWMREAGAPRERLGRGALALLSFAGLFAASWMMVPDLPLLLGWALAFHATWGLCFGRASWDAYARLAAGVALAVLGKYSGVLVAGSAGLALLFWSPRAVRWRGVGAVMAGLAIAAAPIVAWNATHEWSSVLYQLRERHGDGRLSWVRYGRFWAIQLLLAGPVLLAYAFLLARRARAGGRESVRVSRYVAVWALPPALVYCVQPLWADFKPHWAFIVWLPIALELGWAWARGGAERLARVQCGYGLTFVVLGLLLCHVPVTGWVAALATGRDPDPRWDVANDMYGWDGLRSVLSESRLPVIGSRYQTASQAAFAAGDLSRVTLLPRDLKQRDEWPDLGVSEGLGPEWPRLRSEVLFVADNRYDAGPAFPGARCQPFREVERKRWGYLAKRIRVWRCLP